MDFLEIGKEGYRTRLIVDYKKCAGCGIKVFPILKLRVKINRGLCVAAMPISRKAMRPLG
jgi:hypothetical protein